MANQRPGLGPVILTVLLDLLGFGLVIPLMAYYVLSVGATPMQLGLIMAAYSVAQFLFGGFWGALSDRIGRRPVMLISISGTVVFLSLFASATSVWMMLLTRFLHGACAANIGTAQAIVADVTPREERARGMGMIGAAFGIGLTLGPAVGGFLSKWGLAVPIWVAAGLSAVNLIWAFLRLPETRLPTSESAFRRVYDPAKIWGILTHAEVGMAVALTFVATFAFSMLEATFSLVAKTIWTMGPDTAGELFGMIGLIGIVIQGGLIGRLSKRFGSGMLLNVGYVFTASGMGVLAITAPGWLWFGHGWLGIVLGCVLVAIGTSLSNPSLTSLISRAASADEQGNVLGVNQSLAALARASAPAIGTTIFSAWYAGGAFATGAVLMIGALVLSIPAARRVIASERTAAHP